MDTAEFHRLIIERDKECGIGLQGHPDAIARWFFREHNLVTSGRYISKFLEERRKAKIESQRATKMRRLR